MISNVAEKVYHVILALIYFKNILSIAVFDNFPKAQIICRSQNDPAEHKI